MAVKIKQCKRSEKNFVFICAIMKHRQWIFTGLFFCYLQSTAQNTDTVSLLQGALPLSFIYSNKVDSVSNIYVINVHENENTSVMALQNSGNIMQCKLLYLHQYGKRNIAYSQHGIDTFHFDPNRIFTTQGIRNTLETNSHYDNSAALYAQQIADTVLQWLQPALFIIALHNNSDQNYSILSYRRKGIYATDAARHYINPEMDTDDFVFTTDEQLYKWLKKRNINAVLQNNVGVTDDGSLSVYFKYGQIPYVNIEAEHGHSNQQAEMINNIFLYLRENSFLNR